METAPWLGRRLKFNGPIVPIVYSPPRTAPALPRYSYSGYFVTRTGRKFSMEPEPSRPCLHARYPAMGRHQHPGCCFHMITATIPCRGGNPSIRWENSLPTEVYSHSWNIQQPWRLDTMARCTFSKGRRMHRHLWPCWTRALAQHPVKPAPPASLSPPYHPTWLKQRIT